MVRPARGVPREPLGRSEDEVMLQKALSVVAVASLLALAGCEAVKSENPLSPSVAGPIPGVSITAPKPLEPASGAELDKDQQPVTLLVENASSTGVRPLAYVVEVATDSGFANKVFSREGVPPGEGGRTRVQLDVLSPDRTYYWRARAQDGANTGPFSEAASFRIAPPASLDAPPLIAPVGGVTLAALPPVLVFGQAPRVGLVGTVSYRIQVASDSAFGAIVASATVGEQGGQTSFSLPGSFPTGARYYWRVQAFSDKLTGPWSAAGSFVTPAPGGGTPPPSPPPTGGGSSGSCASTDPDYILECIKRTYPSKLAPTATLDQRKANMAYVRDRIIEAGICGGRDFGWNLKRGGPDLSYDFIVVRESDGYHGIDIARDYDNIGATLRLQWGDTGPGGFYRAYEPRPTCR